MGLDLSFRLFRSMTGIRIRMTLIQFQLEHVLMIQLLPVTMTSSLSRRQVSHRATNQIKNLFRASSARYSVEFNLGSLSTKGLH